MNRTTGMLEYSTVSYRFRLKGHAVLLFTSPESLVQKYFKSSLFDHTEETETKRQKQWIYKVTIYREPNINQDEILHSDAALYTRCGLYHLERRALRFQVKYAQNRNGTGQKCAGAVCAKPFCYQ